jgi:hypothetical protein
MLTMLRIATLTGILMLSSATVPVRAQDSPTITFQNQSGEAALVKVVGPVDRSVYVPNAADRMVNVPGGTYYILCRYGEPGNYHYSKGNPFFVTQTSSSVSEIRITLHKVVGGNYATRPISAAEFGQ